MVLQSEKSFFKMAISRHILTLSRSLSLFECTFTTFMLSSSGTIAKNFHAWWRIRSDVESRKLCSRHFGLQFQHQSHRTARTTNASTPIGQFRAEGVPGTSQTEQTHHRMQSTRGSLFRFIPAKDLTTPHTTYQNPSPGKTKNTISSSHYIFN